MKDTARVTPVCGAKVQAAIGRSVDLVIRKKKPAPVEFVSANLAIVEAAMKELKGEDLERAQRTRQQLLNQRGVLEVYGVRA